MVYGYFCETSLGRGKWSLEVMENFNGKSARTPKQLASVLYEINVIDDWLKSVLQSDDLSNMI